MTVPAAEKAGVLHTIALVTLPLGAAVSVGFMLQAGRHNPSRLLAVLFGAWVLSPFLALAVGYVVSKHWTALTRATLDGVILVVTAGTLAIYGEVALGPPRAQTAFVFVVVPPASWVIMGIVVPAAGLVSGRRSRHGGGD